MLDYSGNLQYSIHGFSDYTPGQYSYPAGVSGYGTLFQVSEPLLACPFPRPAYHSLLCTTPSCVPLSPRAGGSCRLLNQPAPPGLVPPHTYPTCAYAWPSAHTTQANSMMALATSAEKMGIPVMGTATMFFIDISAVITAHAENATATV